MLIALFMGVNLLAAALPAINAVGLDQLLFTIKWKPEQNVYGLFSMIMTSVVGAGCAGLIALVFSVSLAVLLMEIVSKKLYNLLNSVIDLLSGIPSVVFGLVGMALVKPVVYELELIFFDITGLGAKHRFTGGANLVAGIAVLVLMLIPAMTAILAAAFSRADLMLYRQSRALGVSRFPALCLRCFKGADGAPATALVVGINRALGESLALSMVSGGAVSLPLPFASVRFLTSGVLMEFGYSSGLHRSALYAAGLVLFMLLLFMNVIFQNKLSSTYKGGRL